MDVGGILKIHLVVPSPTSLQLKTLDHADGIVVLSKSQVTLTYKCR